MRRSIVVLLLLIISQTASGQSTSVSEMRALADPGSEMTFQDVQSLPSDSMFAPISDQTVQPGVDIYWARFRLTNKTDAKTSAVFEFDAWQYIEMFALADSLVERKITGRFVPFVNRNYALANRILIRVDVPARGSEFVYVRYHRESGDIVIPSRLDIILWDEIDLLREVSRGREILSWFAGAFLILFLYNFFVFLSIRGRSYLYYILLMAFLFVSHDWNDGYPISYLKGFPEFVFWHGEADVLLSSILGTVLLLFTRSFLDLKNRMIGWNRFTIALIAVLWILPLVAVSGGTYIAYNISSIIGLLTSVTILSVGVISFRQRFPSANYFLLAYSFFAVGLAVYLLSDLGVIPKTTLTTYGIQFGTLFEATLFAIALANRINILTRENEELLTESNRELAQKVKERTQEIELQNEELFEQRDQLITANSEISKQADEIQSAYGELQDTHSRLKETQAQLVQHEKLASLGQLTAGIAHEIKNPLNFVINFAEDSKELTEELAAEIKKTERSEKTESSNATSHIIGQLQVNLKHIDDHGRRADGIVRSMLEHSRGVRTDRQNVDINVFTRTNIDLAVNGIESGSMKDCVKTEMEFDEGAGSVSLVREDIGRVILNLLDNAYYAVCKKMEDADGDFEPRVLIQTRRVDGGVELRVVDNGPGISADKADNIFEPFFTTKPTGEGIGLGLSLGHDIVTQGHGGSIRVEETPGGGATFVIHLPG